VLVTVAYGLLAWRLFAVIARRAVNVLFWDQWDLYDPLFQHENLWTMFRWQHGPHRLGPGMILTWIVAELSGWDTRVEALVIGGATALNAAVALIVKVAITRAIDAADVLLVLLFLSLRQAAIFLVTPDVSHSAMPLFLVLSFGLALVTGRGYARGAALLTIDALAIYSGFGLLLGVIAPLVWTIDLVRRPPERRGGFAAVALIWSLAALGSFFVGYRFVPAVDCFQFPHPRPREYLVFAALMLARPLVGSGRELPHLLIGAAILVALLAVTGGATVRTLRDRGRGGDRWLAVAVFSGFTLLFVAFAALGRVCLGVTAGQASRYMPYLLPGFLALYLVSRAIRPVPARTTLTALVALLLVGGELRIWWGEGWLTSYSAGKARWAQCYRERRDIAECDNATGFKIYPNAEATSLRSKLDFLEAHRLNLFKGPS
jgi:hypothetical protein